MLLSIVVPLYNEEAVLPVTLGVVGWTVLRAARII